MVCVRANAHGASPDAALEAFGELFLLPISLGVNRFPLRAKPRRQLAVGPAVTMRKPS